MLQFANIQWLGSSQAAMVDAMVDTMADTWLMQWCIGAVVVAMIDSIVDCNGLLMTWLIDAMVD